jgi:hypothetical protein
MTTELNRGYKLRGRTQKSYEMSDSSSDEYEPAPVKRKTPVAKVKRVKVESKSNANEEFISS